MTLALKSPDLVRDIIAVDNAPVDAILSGDFAKYVQGMKQIDRAGVTRQAEADVILKDYESVRWYPIFPCSLFYHLHKTRLQYP